ncbi:MAG: hypothetical protein ACYC9X_06250, partial [Dehalococcoidia bacterium]
RMTGGDPGAAPGTLLAVTAGGVDIALDGGTLHVQRVQPAGGKKQPVGEWAAEAGVGSGDVFEDGATT